jgi:ABC-type sugar transport system ATPase subunit
VIVDAIAGLVPIQSGKITVNNRDITELKQSIETSPSVIRITISSHI